MRFISILRAVERAILTVERWLMVLALGSIIFFGTLNIFLRQFFHSGVVFSDVLARYLTIWLGLLGASYASSQGEQISIDAFSHLFKGKKLSILKAVIYFITSIGSLFFTYLSWKTLVFYYQSPPQPVQLGSLEVPVWVLIALFPVSFTIVAFRYFILSLENFFSKEETLS